VLPVENLTGDSSLVYLSNGMTDQFITDLGQIQALRVISRISVLGFAGSQESPQQIAGKLHVDALLAGSLQQAKDSVHVSLQLISADDGHALWTKSFDAPVQDTRRLQLDVARTVAERIGVDLTPAERARLGSSARTIDPTAFAAYLKGRYHQNKSDFQAADSFFSAALDIDPTYAPAYAGRAEIYNQRGYSGELIPADAFPVAKANAARAIEADSTNAEAHAALAYAVMYYDWDWASAEREYRKAITLNPNSATAHNWYSLFLLAMGRFDEAELEGRRAIQLDPLSVAIAREYGWIAHYSGRQDSAVARIQRALALNEKDKVAHLFLGRAYQAQGRYPEAMREYQATGALLHWPVTVASAGYVAAKEGDREGVARAFAELDSLARAPRTYVAPLLYALIYAALGDKDRAFAFLNQSVEQRVHWLFWLNRDPRWGPLRSDPRFQALARRVGLPK
jgi:TolB-like protein/Tfp pilus assembly protein PilF